MRPHLFVDESKGSAYLLVAACALPNQLVLSRQRMKKLLLPNQRRIHFTKESDGRRRQILEAILGLDVQCTIYQAPSGLTELYGRQACIKRLGLDAIQRGAERIVLELDDSLEVHDRRTLQQTLQGSNGRPLVRYDHQRPHEESLLWIPDAIAWSWAKGGVWRNLVGAAVADVVEL